MTALTPTEAAEYVGLARVGTAARNARASGAGWIAWKGWVRISLKWITDSGDVDHGFR